MAHPIFRWSGQYFGFLSGSNLFDAGSRYVGWIADDGQAWKADGSYLGELVDDHYILRNSSSVSPVARVPKVAPVSPVPPVSSVARVGRVGRAGWVDALKDL